MQRTDNQQLKLITSKTTRLFYNSIANRLPTQLMPLPVNWQVDGGRETHGKKESKLIKTNHIANENVLLLPSTTTTIIIIAEKTLKQLKRNEKKPKESQVGHFFHIF